MPVLVGPAPADIDQVGLDDGQLTFVDGELHCAAGPNGFWATKRVFRNFHLQLEYRFARPADLVDDAAFTGNSGYLVYMRGNGRPWPACIEVQGMHADVARIFAIAGAKEVTDAFDDPEARRVNRRPVGEWNSVDIESNEGALTAYLNGVRISSGSSPDLREGPIGFQCEGAEIHWRNVKITTSP